MSPLVAVLLQPASVANVVVVVAVAAVAVRSMKKPICETRNHINKSKIKKKFKSIIESPFMRCALRKLFCATPAQIGLTVGTADNRIAGITTCNR